MQRNLWTRPALHASEAVLLPALPMRRAAEPRFSDLYTRASAREDPFRPLPAEPAAPAAAQAFDPTFGQTFGQAFGQSLALSTFVRPRGSMAGRGVLRAAGVAADPFYRARPRYAPPRMYLATMGARLRRR